MRVRSTPAPGYRLVLLAILLATPFAMLPTADMPTIATAAPGGAGQPAKAYEIDPGPAP